jgi:integrase/recombinase XerC
MKQPQHHQPIQSTTATTSRRSLEAALQLFLQELAARNLSANTLTAYATDLRQFIAWLQTTDGAITRPDQITKREITAYLAYLGGVGLSGVTRARKLASLRSFFQCLVENHLIAVSPAGEVSMPKKERKAIVYLRSEEYSRLLAAAGGNPRDYAILQLFLQTGIRVAELVALRLADLDLADRTLRIAGKGQKERIIDLEKKAIVALKSYLAVRPASGDAHLFLNYQGQGLSDRGIKKIVEKYRELAGIQKKVSCHSLRHTFATYKAERGVSAFQLKEWLGHSSLTMPLHYVHLGRSNASKKLMEATSL